MKLIDKDALVAEIDKFMYGANLEADIASTGECFNEEVANAKYKLCKQIKEEIDTLEVKEVDLENKWIDCSERMPEETKRNSDFLQVQQEWNESEKVLAYDSMYGARVDYTVNGKWHSELQRGVGGQILHGIIAWMPIPKYV